MLKGAVPVLIAHALGVDSVILALTMFAAFLGHVFPVFHGFKGGKGVATAFGALVAMNGWVGLALVGSWLVMASTTRYSSLSAITVAVLAPVYVWWFTHEPALILATGVMAFLLLWRHRSNIQETARRHRNKNRPLVNVNSPPHQRERKGFLLASAPRAPIDIKRCVGPPYDCQFTAL